MPVPLSRRAALAAAAVPFAGPLLVAGEEENAGGGPLAGMRADHACVNVADFGTGLAWYRDVLGFRELVRWTVDGLAETQLAYLELNGFRIELVAGPTTADTAQLPRAGNFAEHFAERGITHLCFAVSDVDAALNECARRGAPTFSPGLDFPPLGLRVGFIQDPFGNVIEFKGPMTGDNAGSGAATWAPGESPATLNG